MSRLRIAFILALVAGCGRGEAPRSTSQQKAAPDATHAVEDVDPTHEVLPAADDDAPQRVGEFVPDYSKAKLVTASQTVSSVRIRERWPAEYLVGKALIRIRDVTIESIDNSTGTTQWSVQSDSPAPLHWLGEHRGMVFLADVHSGRDENNNRIRATDGVRRLSLQNGEWQSPLVIPFEAAERDGESHVSAFLGDGDGVLVLTNTETEEFQKKQIGYRITRFSADSPNVIWSKFYESAGTLPTAGAFLFGSLGLARDTSSIQRLSRMGSQVIVCGGPLECLMAIQPVNGTVDWQVPRLWEFRRGFIGPSVWQHFLGRYGVQDHDLALAQLTLKELQEKNEKGDGFFADEKYVEELKESVGKRREEVIRQLGSITAGPVVVAAPEDEDGFRDGKGFRIFVATAQCENGQWPGYLSDCVIYEVDQSGKVLGILKLPRFVRRNAYSVLDDSVVWDCEADQVARLFPSRDSGNDGLIIDLEWRIHRHKTDRNAWFQNGNWTSSVAFAGNTLVRVQNGGLVRSEQSGTYEFRFSAINVLTGASKELSLLVPFDGRIRLPNNNYSRSSGKDGQDTWVSYTDLPLILADVEFRSSNLAIVMEAQKKRETLEFDLTSVLNDNRP